MRVVVRRINYLLINLFGNYVNLEVLDLGFSNLKVELCSHLSLRILGSLLVVIVKHTTYYLVIAITGFGFISPGTVILVGERSSFLHFYKIVELLFL